jgi:outer membrane lipoprotein-sorting protein
MRRVVAPMALVALLLANACGATTPAVGTGAPAPSRRLMTRLEHAGRLEAAVVQVTPDPLGGPTVERGGRLAIERPERVRIDYRDGERVTLRDDGGEWLQPRLQQMLAFDADAAGAVASAWNLLLGHDATLATRVAGARTWRLVPASHADGLPDSVEVELDRAGMPRRMTAWTGEATLTFRISAWRAAAPLGRRGFVLAAPPGYEVIRSGR